jgi:hypothetical protein
MILNVCHVENESDSIKTVSDSCSFLNSQFAKKFGTENSVEIRYFNIRSIEEFKTDFAKTPFDILIIDLKLGPGTDNLEGYNSLYLIRDLEIIPVIVFSAYAGELPDDKELKKLLITSVPKGGPDTDLLIKTLNHVAGLKYFYILQKDRITNEFAKITLETISELMKNEDLLKVNSNLFAIFATSRLTSLLLNSPPNDQKIFPRNQFYFSSRF